MATRRSDISVDELSAAAAAYRRLLSKAIRLASPGDAATLQRLGAGLGALTKAVSTVERVKKETDNDAGRPVVLPLD